MNLSENIKNLRITKGISQVQFAKELGVTKQCVSNWENDNILPSIEMLIRIATFFDVTTDFLLGLQTDCVILVDGLNDEEISHIRDIVKDIKKYKK